MKTPPVVVPSATMALALALWLGAAPPAAASNEDCVQCKHADCIKGTIKRMTALADGYQALSEKWGRLIRDGNGEAIHMQNLNLITDPAERQNAYRSIMEKHNAFLEDENRLSNRVGPAAGCPSGATSEVGTDTYETCKVDDGALRTAIGEVPCKQLGQVLADHEGLHRDRCLLRKNRTDVGDFWKLTATGANNVRAEKYLPPLIQTPAGKAAEEAIAYRAGVATLQELLKQAEKKCRLGFKGVKTSCRMEGGVIEYGQEIAGQVCGEPVGTLWQIDMLAWMNVTGAGRQNAHRSNLETECVLKGSDKERNIAAVYQSNGAGGWMCVYEPGDPPKVTIRHFRLPQCSPNTEQVITVNLERGDCKAQTAPAPPRPPAPGPNRPIS